MHSYRPAFNDIKMLKTLLCSIVAMSTTLTGQCVLLTKGVYWDNLELSLLCYKRCRSSCLGNENLDEMKKQILVASSTMWEKTVSVIEPVLSGCSTVVYLDFVIDMEEVADNLR